MTRLAPVSAGLTLGTVIAAWHLLWVVLVAVHLAQPLLDFIFWLHLIQPVYVVQPFAPLPALLLLVVTFAVGFSIGAVFAVVWNRFHARGA